MPVMNTAEAAKLMEALGNETRLEIFRLLIQAGTEGMPVGDIQRVLDIPASTLSHHIARLMHGGLVSQERESRVLRCRADYVRIRTLLSFLMDKCCNGVC